MRRFVGRDAPSPRPPNDDERCRDHDDGDTAARWLNGRFERARVMREEQASIPTMLSKNQFNRRLRRIKSLFLSSLRLLGEHFKGPNAELRYVIHSFPIPAPDNSRISRAKRFQEETYRGYVATTRRHSLGPTIHV